ncbi:hypothetical protein SAMN04487906_2723 [Zhouia amylolytica]|uniref:Uncharacterized protein n=2 Tax=Zhouia amylolytica TaxID=376730 RepID=W2UTY9_9FLAO|nr:hypothetical protein [Zhouia amylolytica]ETN97001.1 hypothetical protein P278_04270 [Zhouia amylolytica AD3]MCQ0110154.1 hypothetical protein [Zhouia amylolytica]SFT06473.1 hypothetical protein SAMN04487906_2723 [Zhouia amylolytica]
MKSLIIITKIVAFYCLFYAGVKVFGVFQGMWLVPNLFIALILLINAALGFIIIKRNSYNWWYAIIGVVFISALRYYESEVSNYLYQLISTT